MKKGGAKKVSGPAKGNLWMGDELSFWRPDVECFHAPMRSNLEAFIVKNRIRNIYLEPYNDAWGDRLVDLVEDCEGVRDVFVFRWDWQTAGWFEAGSFKITVDYGQLFDPVIPRLRKMKLPKDVLIVAANICWWDTQEPNPYLYKWTNKMAQNVNRELLIEALKAVGHSGSILPSIGRKKRKWTRRTP